MRGKRSETIDGVRKDAAKQLMAIPGRKFSKRERRHNCAKEYFSVTRGEDAIFLNAISKTSKLKETNLSEIIIIIFSKNKRDSFHPNTIVALHSSSRKTD